jgi:hypothetical protein
MSRTEATSSTLDDQRASDRWRPSARAIHTRTPRGGVVLDVTTKTYFTLNVTGDVLWRALERIASRDELVAALREEFEVDPATAARDVEGWLGELCRARLIESARDPR